MSPMQSRANGTDQLLTHARRERARAGMAGYDPLHHRRLAEEFASASRSLPRSLRLCPNREYLLKKEKSH